MFSKQYINKEQNIYLIKYYSKQEGIKMVSKREENRINKTKEEWKEKLKEMGDSFKMLEKTYGKLPWHKHFWKKAKMHGLLRKNEEIFDMANKEWKEHKFDFFGQKDYEFQENYRKYKKILDKKIWKLKKMCIKPDYAK